MNFCELIYVVLLSFPGKKNISPLWDPSKTETHVTFPLFLLQMYFTMKNRKDQCNKGIFVWLNTGKAIINRGNQTSQINDISVIHIWLSLTTDQQLVSSHDYCAWRSETGPPPPQLSSLCSPLRFQPVYHCYFYSSQTEMAVTHTSGAQREASALPRKGKQTRMMTAEIK